MKIIGLAGLAGAGKDTVGAMLEQNVGYCRMALADSLKEAAGIIFGLSYQQLYGREEREIVDKRWGMTSRQILQKVGTECFRETFGEDVWVNSLFNNVPIGTKRLVITDVRFENEVNAVKKRGGVVVWIDRPGLVRMEHASEQFNPAWADCTINNDGSLRDLSIKVQEFLDDN